MKHSSVLPPPASAILDATTSLDLSPKTIAEIVLYCIKHETKPGGPYAFNTIVPDEIITKKLKQLFGTSSSSQVVSLTPARDRVTVTNARRLFKASAYEKVRSDPSILLTSPARNVFNKILQRIEDADTNGEISLLTYYFRESLRSTTQSENKQIARDNFRYAQANILTWTAYTAIDAILDNPDTHPHISLEVSLSCVRRATELYSLAGAAYSLRESLFSAVDQANTLELEVRKDMTLATSLHGHDSAVNSSYTLSTPTLQRVMADKSIAHIIGPRSLLLGYTQAVQHDAARAFELYCGARQLLDDMHDWQEDLHNGHITYVIAKLLECSGVAIGSYQKPELTQTLKQTFWNSILEECCNEIIRMTEESRILLETNLLIKNSSFISVTIEPIQRAAKSALLKHLVGKELVASLSIKNPS